MKKILAIVVITAQTLVMWSCATAWQGTVYTDDLYSIHNKTAIANRQKAEAELAKAQYEAQQAQYEATLARIKAEAAKQGITVTEGVVNGYDAVLADTYESAYARRLYGFSSPTYRMPSSYYTLRYSDAFHYASAYDPAFYNVVVSGDMVWVGFLLLRQIIGNGIFGISHHACARQNFLPDGFSLGFVCMERDRQARVAVKAQIAFKLCFVIGRRIFVLCFFFAAGQQKQRGRQQKNQGKTTRDGSFHQRAPPFLNDVQRNGK